VRKIFCEIFVTFVFFMMLVVGLSNRVIVKNAEVKMLMIFFVGVGG